MRFIKLGLISIAFFCLLLAAISSLLPSSINIVRTVDINAPADSIRANLGNLANWKNWYADYDSSKVTLSANTTGRGATININNTIVTILKDSAGKVEALWQPGKGRPLPGEFNLVKKQTDSIVTVQWRFNYQVKWYPWEKFAAVFSDKAIGPFMEKSLENLKLATEKL
jgi:hypothetical protein